MRTIHTWFAEHPMVGDGLLALVFTPAVVSGFSDRNSAFGNGWFGVLLGLTVLTSMLWRRTCPEIFTTVLVASHLLILFAWPPYFNPAHVLVPVALYAEAAYSRWRHYRWWIGVGVIASFAAGVKWHRKDVEAEYYSQPPILIVVLAGICLTVVAASWVAGELTRQRREIVQALQERTEALERERDQRVRLAAQEERSRIAREMHDIVAHNLSVIVVQADGAAYAAQHHPDPDMRARHSADALATIGETAREALAETRRLVGVLRSEDDGVEYTPQATLDQIQELVERMAHAGVQVTYRVDGDPHAHAPLNAGAEMAVYRVVQESLTNVVKHAGPAVTAQVILTHSPRQVQVTVLDDGTGTRGGSDGAGHGLIGMQERVSTYGGTLVARDRMAGGFEVSATLPVDPQDEVRSAQG